VFIGPSPPGKGIVLHRNGNSKDNRLENLDWGNSQQNSLDRHKHNGTSKGGLRSRPIKRAAVVNPLRDSLADAIMKGGSDGMISIPVSFAQEILEALSTASDR
jgi:HNH endonuclease